MKTAARALVSLIAASMLSWLVSYLMISPWSGIPKWSTPALSPSRASIEIAQWVVLLGGTFLFYRWSGNKTFKLILSLLGGFWLSFMATWIILVYSLRHLDVPESALGSAFLAAIITFAVLTVGSTRLFYVFVR